MRRRPSLERLEPRCSPAHVVVVGAVTLDLSALDAINAACHVQLPPVQPPLPVVAMPAAPVTVVRQEPAGTPQATQAATADLPSLEDQAVFLAALVGVVGRQHGMT